MFVVFMKTVTVFAFMAFIISCISFVFRVTADEPSVDEKTGWTKKPIYSLIDAFIYLFIIFYGYSYW